MANIELGNYVRECRGAGIDDTVIRKKLLSVGWLEADVKSALGRTPSGQSPRKFSLKLLLILILSVLVLGAIAFAGYYILILKKSSISGSNQETINTELAAEGSAPATNPENQPVEDTATTDSADSASQEPAPISCTAEDFSAAPQPVKIGTPKVRITSTMNLFISALQQGNQCQALSLFSDREKYAQTIGSIFSSEDNVTMSSEFKNFTIPVNINVKNLLTLKAIAKVKDETGKDIEQEIYFVPQESGEYLISQI